MLPSFIQGPSAKPLGPHLVACFPRCFLFVPRCLYLLVHKCHSQFSSMFTAAGLNTNAVGWDTTAKLQTATAGIEHRVAKIQHCCRWIEKHRCGIEHHCHGIAHYRRGAGHQRSGIAHHGRRIEHQRRGIEHHGRRIEHWRRRIEHHGHRIEHNGRRIEHKRRETRLRASRGASAALAKNCLRC